MHPKAESTFNISERPVLDLEHVKFQTVAPGSIRVTGTWMMHPTRKVSQPCLVLTDARRPLKPGMVIPIIIPLSEAYRWMRELQSEADFDDCMTRCHQWMKLGYLPGSAHNELDLFHVFSAIECRLRDLVAMEPMPAAPAIKHSVVPTTIGEMVITNADTGAVVQEIEVKANVRR